MRREKEIHKAEGKLGVLIPGMGGAVSTTFLAGVEAVRRGASLPFGSLTQMGTIRLGKRFEYRIPRIKDFVPLADLGDLVFGGWDVFPANGYQAALEAKGIGLVTERTEAAAKTFNALRREREKVAACFHLTC